jgi:hypothetical protein
MAKKQNKLSPEQREKVRKERADGTSIRALSLKYKCSESQIVRIVDHVSSDSNFELDQIEQRIAELKERKKQIKSRSVQRNALVEYCNRRGLTRADLYAAAVALPLLRVSRAHREAKAKGEGGKA